MIPTGYLQDLAGQFRPESAQIQRAAETHSGDGTTTSWTTIATVSARISPNGASSEALGGDQSMQAVSPYRIALPVGTDVTPRDRIVISGRTFEVNAVEAKSFAAELYALCKEIS